MHAPESTIEQQQALIASLRNRASFPEPCSSVELIETHISWVLLCGRYAYKIKKALYLGFLDFSTLAKRKHYCLEELRLNRRLAPHLYLDVVAIGVTPDGPLLGADVNPIEYAVKMARFEQSELLDRRLREGRLDGAHIDRLATLIADFHARQPSTPPRSDLGTAQAVHDPVRANFKALRSTIRDAAMLRQIATVETWSEREYGSLRERFDRRRRDGFVRECHGDMHLGNMAVHEQELMVFDGIEFNPALYWIDVISEAAFLFMDLEDHGRTDYAWRFLNRYLNQTGDYPGVRLLRYYLCYRAMVRAKVAGIRAVQSPSTDATAALREYLCLASRYSAPMQPTLIISHGVSGSGKSTVCAPLATRIGALHLRSDRERQRLFGRGGEQSIDAGAYTADASDRTYARLYECAELALAARFSVIVDATFLDPERRNHFAALAANQGARHRILQFDAEAGQLRDRIRRRQSSGEDISEADQAVLEHQLAHYTPLTESELGFTIRTDTASAGVDELVNQISRQLATESATA